MYFQGHFCLMLALITWLLRDLSALWNERGPLRCASRRRAMMPPFLPYIGGRAACHPADTQALHAPVDPGQLGPGPAQPWDPPSQLFLVLKAHELGPFS